MGRVATGKLNIIKEIRTFSPTLLVPDLGKRSINQSEVLGVDVEKGFWDALTYAVVEV